MLFRRSLLITSQRWLSIAGRKLKRLPRVDFRLIPRDGQGDTALAARILTRRLIPLYLLVSTAIWICAIVLGRWVPSLIGFWAPLAFTTLVGFRIRHWNRMQQDVPNSGHIRREVARLQKIGPCIAVVVATWFVIMDQYAVGSLASVVHLTSAICGFAAILCLGATPFTATTVALSAIGASVLCYSLSNEPHRHEIAFLQVMFVLATGWVSFSFQSDFLRLVAARRALARRERKTSRLANRQEFEATFDLLTGLFNRRAFMARVQRCIAGEEGRKSRVAIIDLDGFKTVNDTMGHAAGDALLAVLAQRIAQAVPGAVAGRLGGDEFALWIPIDDDKERIDAVLANLVERLCEPVQHQGMDVSAGASLGYYDCDLGFAQSLSEILERADQAMYAAKQQPGPAVVAFDEEMERRWQIRQLLICRVNQPDFENHLSLVYQPIWDTQRNLPVAIEALVRWDSPVLGRIPAAEFIEIANASGRMLEVTAGIIRRAVQQCPAWEWDCDLHLNVTGRDLLSPGAMGRLATILLEAGAPPDRIVFEIAETSIGNLDAAIPIMVAMRDRGFRFALDDLGGGASSLGRLSRLPIDMIKVDVQFTKSMLCDGRCQAIVETLIEFARKTKLDCVLEGVETMDQVLGIARIGGRYMQGYFFDQPLNAEVAGAMLSTLVSVAPPVIAKTA